MTTHRTTQVAYRLLSATLVAILGSALFLLPVSSFAVLPEQQNEPAGKSKSAEPPKRAAPPGRASATLSSPITNKWYEGPVSLRCECPDGKMSTEHGDISDGEWDMNIFVPFTVGVDPAYREEWGFLSVLPNAGLGAKRQHFGFVEYFSGTSNTLHSVGTLWFVDANTIVLKRIEVENGCYVRWEQLRRATGVFDYIDERTDTERCRHLPKRYHVKGQCLPIRLKVPRKVM